MSIPHVETPIEVFAGHIIRSDVRPAEEGEILSAKEHYEKTGQCDHSIVVDEPGGLYDFRYCFTCGAGLGAI